MPNIRDLPEPIQKKLFAAIKKYDDAYHFVDNDSNSWRPPLNEGSDLQTTAFNMKMYTREYIEREGYEPFNPQFFDVPLLALMFYFGENEVVKHMLDAMGDDLKEGPIQARLMKYLLMGVVIDNDHQILRMNPKGFEMLLERNLVNLSEKFYGTGGENNLCDYLVDQERFAAYADELLKFIFKKEDLSKYAGRNAVLEAMSVLPEETFKRGVDDILGDYSATDSRVIRKILSSYFPKHSFNEFLDELFDRGQRLIQQDAEQQKEKQEGDVSATTFTAHFDQKRSSDRPAGSAAEDTNRHLKQEEDRKKRKTPE